MSREELMFNLKHKAEVISSSHREEREAHHQLPMLTEAIFWVRILVSEEMVAIWDLKENSSEMILI